MRKSLKRYIACAAAMIELAQWAARERRIAKHYAPWYVYDWR